MNQPNDATGVDYRDSHRDPSKPARYDAKYFDPTMTLGLIWQIEQKILRELIDNMSPAPKRALDFACGTGRVLSLLEGLVPECVGVDISPAMLEFARERCRKANLIEADLTVAPDKAPGPFDLITSFRFLLNAQTELRHEALHAIRARIEDDGLFITNFHRNPTSMTGIYLRTMSRLRGHVRPNMIGLKEALELLRSNGFEPVAVRSYGYMLQRTQRLSFPSFSGAVEKYLADWNPLPSLSTNFIVAARPIPTTTVPTT